MSQNTSRTPTQAGHWVVTEFGGPSVLKWRPFPEGKKPTSGTNNTLLRVLITGISGADNIQRAGGYTRVPQTSKPGFTPGYDCVGVIESLGELDGSDWARKFNVGDLVATICVTGAYATHIVVPLEDCLPLRKDDDLIKVVALPLNYMTALGMLKLSAFAVTEGTESILIGSVAGGVGTAVAQVARMLFPNLKIFGTCSEGKFDYVRGLGVVPIDRNEPAEKIAEKIRELNAGRGVDVAYEATGSEVNMRAFLSATKEDSGRLIAIGMMANVKSDGSSTTKETFDPISFAAANSERMSFFSVTNHYWRGQREKFREDFEDVLLLAVREGRLNPAIGSLWQLKDAVEINEMLASGRGITGKLEMIVDEDLWSRFGDGQSGRR
jgi:NADPH:quinone reductase